MRNVSPRFNKTPNHINLDRVETPRGFRGKIFFFSSMNIYSKRWATTIVETRGYDRQFRYVIRLDNPLDGKIRSQTFSFWGVGGTGVGVERYKSSERRRDSRLVIRGLEHHIDSHKHVTVERLWWLWCIAYYFGYWQPWRDTQLEGRFPKWTGREPILPCLVLRIDSTLLWIIELPFRNFPGNR